MARTSAAESKRKEIVQAFRQCILAMGMDRASMKEVAKIVGLDRSTLHYYYPKRAQLVDDLVEEISGRYQEKLVNAISAMPNDQPAIHLVDFLFGDKWHDAENSQLIDEISTVFGRDTAIEDPVGQLYRENQELLVDVFLKSFPNTPSSQVREACYAIHQLVEGAIIFACYDFPRNRRTAALKAARRIVQSLKD